MRSRVNLTRGISVSYNGEDIDIEIHIIVEYGTRINSVAESVANTVRFHVEKALGLQGEYRSTFMWRDYASAIWIRSRETSWQWIPHALRNSVNNQINGQSMKRLVEAGMIWLRTNQQTVNALNVFPVPDGDTGTNMVLTMQSAWNEIKDLGHRSISDMAAAVSKGALMGARGNSGVILSQLWRGFARGVHGRSAGCGDTS